MDPRDGRIDGAQRRAMSASVVTVLGLGKAMIDFERLGSAEKALAKRLLFIWSFTRGMTRYPGRFVLDHPPA